MDDQIQTLVDQCVAAEKSFKMQVADLSHSFEVYSSFFPESTLLIFHQTNFAKFSKLDARINRVGSSAARIGVYPY